VPAAPPPPLSLAAACEAGIQAYFLH